LLQKVQRANAALSTLQKSNLSNPTLSRAVQQVVEAETLLEEATLKRRVALDEVCLLLDANVSEDEEVSFHLLPVSKRGC
jgi:hypothetical protein